MEEEAEEDEEEEEEEEEAAESNPNHNHIPLEIVSEDEMALIEAALSAAAAAAAVRIPSSSSSLLSVSRSLKRTITSPLKRTLACCSNAGTPSEEIEDLGDNSHMKEKKKKSGEGLTSLYLKFRNRRGLSVTDITRSVSCPSPPFFADRLKFCKSPICF